MIPLARLFSVGVWAFPAGLPPAGHTGDAPVPSAAGDYGVVRNRQGEDTASAKGRQTPLRLQLQCEMVSGGRSVPCRMDGRDQDGDLALSETDLFGDDPVTGTEYRYAETDRGETRGHRVSWSGPDTLPGGLSWQQDGRAMAEHTAHCLSSATCLNTRSVLRVGREGRAGFTGNLRQQRD